MGYEMPPKKAALAVDGKEVSVYNLDNVFRTRIKFKNFWFEDVPNTPHWKFKGHFGWGLEHPHSHQVLLEKGELVVLKEPSKDDDPSEDDW